jgi:hypothetical protein
MTGGIFQLKAIGQQDAFLTKYPTQNFIKQSYNQYVNFSKDQISIYPKENVDFGKKWSIIIPKFGDYVNNIYLNVKLPKLTRTSGTYAGWTNSVGNVLVKEYSIQIGDYIIDKRYGLYAEIWEELSSKTPKENILIGKYAHVSRLPYTAEYDTEYFVPLDFWFCKNLGAALPLFAMRFNTVTIHFEFELFDNCVIYDGLTPPNSVSILETKLIADYVYIDENEKNKLFDTEFEFVISQLQAVMNEDIPRGGPHSIDLPFNHPCSELIWVFREKASEENNDWFNFGVRNGVVFTDIFPLMEDAKLLLDGTERNRLISGNSLNTLNVNKYHTSGTEKFIYCLPFCESPEVWYPTGTLNFSRVSHALLSINLITSALPVSAFVFAKNYNIIRIKNGEISISFSS